METTSSTQPKTKKHHHPSRNTNPPPNPSPGSRHERLCSICQHPRREDIDDDILRWRSPQDIVYDFDLSDRSAVYRHARATKLLTQRKQNLNPALERVIESVYDAKPSMNAVLKAMAIYARINGNEAYKTGFTDPPKHTIITHVTVRGESAAASNNSVGAPLAAPSANPARSATEGQGFSPAEENVVRSTTQGSPAGAREEVVAVVEPPVPAPEPPDSRTAIEMVPVHFAGAPPEYFLKMHPELKRFLPTLSVMIPLVLLGSLLWTALLGLGSTVSAAVSATPLSAAASATNFPVPLVRLLPPLPPAFYSPQTSQSKIHNPLKTHGKSISYSPQKRNFLRLRRRRDPSVTAPSQNLFRTSGDLRMTA